MKPAAIGVCVVAAITLTGRAHGQQQTNTRRELALRRTASAS
jgi:hypothetical protein